jgi:integrase/recombinase XerD
MTPLAPHLTAFFQERLPRERQVSIHTCDAYAYTFRLLLSFAARRLRTSPSSLSLEQLDTPLVLAFLDDLQTTRGNSPRTSNARLSAIKSFARYLEYRVPSCADQVRRLLAIPQKKTDETLVAYLTREEMQAVLDAPDPRRREGVRDLAMLHLAFAGGLRVSELVGLMLEDIQLRPQAVVHIKGKGRRERVLPLWKTTTTALRAWLNVRGDSSCRELFVNARGSPLSRDGFAYILSKNVAAATASAPSLKNKRVTPHVLRHTCAMQTLEATHDVRRVALWLGHARLETTEIYLRVDPTAKLEAIDAVLPPDLRRGRFRAPDKLLASLHPGRRAPPLSRVTIAHGRSKKQPGTALSSA